MFIAEGRSDLCLSVAIPKTKFLLARNILFTPFALTFDISLWNCAFYESNHLKLILSFSPTVHSQLLLKKKYKKKKTAVFLKMVQMDAI